jgi:uncharacterized protein YjbI with pentapeptide repeats
VMFEEPQELFEQPNTPIPRVTPEAFLQRLAEGQTNFQGEILIRADLRGINLAGCNLQGADLSGADLRSANLRGADLRRAKLATSSFSGLYNWLAGPDGSSSTSTQIAQSAANQ